MFERFGFRPIDKQLETLAAAEMKFDRSLNQIVGWSNVENKEFFISERLIEKWIKQFLTQIEKENNT